MGESVFNRVRIIKASLASLRLETSICKGSCNDGNVFKGKFDVADLSVKLNEGIDVGVFWDQSFLLQNVCEAVVLMAVHKFCKTHLVVESNSSTCNHFA